MSAIRPLDEIERRDDFASRHIGPAPQDVDAMLEAIGVPTLDDLIDRTVPASANTPHALTCWSRSAGIAPARRRGRSSRSPARGRTSTGRRWPASTTSTATATSPAPARRPRCMAAWWTEAENPHLPAPVAGTRLVELPYVSSPLPMKSSTKRQGFFRQPAFGSGYAGLGRWSREDRTRPDRPDNRAGCAFRRPTAVVRRPRRPRGGVIPSWLTPPRLPLGGAPAVPSVSPGTRACRSAAQRCSHRAGRFSRNARIPSCLSAVENAMLNNPRSASSPDSRVVS